MLKQTSLVGQVIGHRTIHVTDDMLRRLKNALDGWHQVDKKTAISSFFLGSLGDHQKAYERLKIKPNRQLHSRESLFVCDPIKPGDVIEVETVLGDLYEQHGSSIPIGFVVTDVWGKKANSVIFHSQRIMAVRGGFERRYHE